jgi:hypothetical protein
MVVGGEALGGDLNQRRHLGGDGSDGKGDVKGEEGKEEKDDLGAKIRAIRRKVAGG